MKDKWGNTPVGKEWHKEYNASNPCLRVKIRKDSGIMEALNKACSTSCVTKNDYIRQAVRERMEDDKNARHAKEKGIR